MTALDPRRIGIALIALIFVPLLARAEDYRIGPPPFWVNQIELVRPEQVPEAQISNGTHYLLVDQQVQLDEDGGQRFRRYATQALTDSGLDVVANIQLDFDPTYEDLTLHSILVHRDGKSLSRLDSSTKALLQRESDLESRLFDGNLTLSITVDDVRVGDIVEYAYTITGVNPVFDGIASGAMSMQWSVPVAHAHLRLRVPQARKVKVALSNSEEALKPSKQGGSLDYVWQQQDIAAVVVESGAPGWYQPRAVLRWSEFADWGDVVDWAVPLYTVPRDLSEDMRELVGSLKSENASAEEQLLAALRWVQTEIRYLGIEIGAGSHRPSPPELVMRRRFGDCKDKTRLLLTLLAEMGIQASPALVNSNRERGLGELLPTPGAFDHVLVMAKLNGKQYWLDPTLSPQSGNLQTLDQPDYGLALLVSPSQQQLSKMDAERPLRLKRIEATLDSRAGLDKPVAFTVKTINEGRNAELARSLFASDSIEEIQQSYLNYYAAYYPGIRSTGPLELVEDAQANRLTITERYELPKFWTYSEAEQQLVATIEAPDISDLLQAPSTPQRRAPLALSHPLEVHMNTRVLLPEPWPEVKIDKEVENPHFRFKHVGSGGGVELQFTDHYQSLADHIPAAGMDEYVAKLDSARDLLGYTLYAGSDDPAVPEMELGWLQRMDWTVTLLALMLVIVFSTLALRLYRYDPAPRETLPNPALTGIRGWLLLPALGVILTPILALITLKESVSVYTLPTWTMLTQPGAESYHALWEPLLLFELAAMLGMTVFGVLLLVLFFGRRRSAPRVYLGVYGASVLVLIAEYLMIAALPETEGLSKSEAAVDAARNALHLLIWGSYFLSSERVRCTFTRTHWRNETPTAAAATVAPVATERSVPA